MRNKTKKQLLLFLVPLAIVGLLWAFYPRSVYVYRPGKVEAYDDQADGGNSKGRILSAETPVVFESVIGDALKYPYSGFRLINSELTDLNTFNELHLTLKASLSRRLSINMVMNDYQLKGGKNVPLVMTAQLKYIEGLNKYVVPLERFEIPTWWFLNHGLDETDIAETSMNNISSIDIQSDQLLAPGTTDVITFYELQFKNNPTDVLVIFSATLLIADLLVLIGFLFSLKYKVQLVPVPYLGQEVDNLAQSDIERIQHYVSHNYHLPITTQMVQRETGIAKSKIPTLLKEKLNTTLKKLLTSIRLNEAKRLLKESDLPINEVAEQVGFGHVSHFNRVFKEAEGKTPNEFRTQEVV